MRPDRVAVYGTVAIVGLLTLATGPSIGFISVPQGGIGGHTNPGTGTADLAVVDAPSRADLVVGDYADVYYLTVPETEVRLSDVSGSPILTVSVDIDDLGYSRSTVFFLSESMEGTKTFTVERDALEARRINAEQYGGRLRLTLVDDRGRATVFEEPIDIEVDS